MASLWEKVFGKPKEQPITHNYQDFLNGLIPIYSGNSGNNIYVYDVVQQAVYSIITELKKLDPVHVRKLSDGDFASVDGSIQRTLDAPNPLMTTSDFIEKVAWTLLLNDNAFISPVWEGNDLVALYPLQPTLVEFDTNYGGTGETWVRFHFANGYKGDVPYDRVIHVRRKFSVSEFMGGNEQGQPDFTGLKDTLSLNETLLKGLAKSLNLQMAINGIVKLRTTTNMDDRYKKVKEFEERLQSTNSGMLALDNIEDFTPIQKQIQLLDSTTLEFIDKKILRTFGVSIPIVNGDYTKDQYEAFYQKTLEPIVKSLGQAFTKGLFSKRAANGFNNRIVFYVKELIFMNTDQKLNLFKDLSAQGGVYVNEYRTAFGMRPINDLQGVRMMSLNWVDSKYAQEYQTGKPQNGSENGGANNE